jgi:hypothetical protein
MGFNSGLKGLITLNVMHTLGRIPPDPTTLTRDKHAPGDIQTLDPHNRADIGLNLRSHGHQIGYMS